MRFMLSYTGIISNFLMGFSAVTLPQYNNLLYNLQFRFFKAFYNGPIIEVFILHALKFMWKYVDFKNIYIF